RFSRLAPSLINPALILRCHLRREPRCTGCPVNRMQANVKTMSRRVSNHGERGSTMAEFAVVALVFFTMIVGIIEFGRLLYTHNALTDATRRGARYAVLHSSASTACVERVVVYGEA